MAFSLTEQTLDWLDRAPARASEEVDLHATPDEVFATLADHEGWASWFPGMTKGRADGSGTGVGGRRTIWLGPLAVNERFLAWDPGSRFAFTVVSASGPGFKSVVEDMTITPGVEAGWCKLRYTVGAEGAVPLANRGLKLVTRQIVARGTGGLRKKFS